MQTHLEGSAWPAAWPEPARPQGRAAASAIEAAEAWSRADGAERSLVDGREKIGRHPVGRLYDRGVHVAIGDDDPVTSRTSISSELTLLREPSGFNHEEPAGLSLTALDASFLRDSDPPARLRAALCPKGIAR